MGIALGKVTIFKQLVDAKMDVTEVLNLTAVLPNPKLSGVRATSRKKEKHL